MRRQGSSEDGFTLIELLVVILIIGILAAIALPAFLGQRAKGQDASAKSDARNMVTQIEACFIDYQTYASCTSNATIVNTNLPLSDSMPPPSGQVGARGSTATYTITAVSRSGNSFTITKGSDGAVTRTCSLGGSTSGACTTGTW